VFKELGPQGSRRDLTEQEAILEGSLRCFAVKAVADTTQSGVKLIQIFL
jgi:hypothetical protein